MDRNVIIVGGGPAGYTAAIYAARANLKPLVLAGYAAGGQLMTTTEVENFPGFPEGVLGPDLMENMKKQAERFGAEILYKDVTKVELGKHPFEVTYEETTVKGRSIIIATGASPRKLGLDSEKKLWSKGVTSCATCDGAFYKGKEVAVAGGGDSAMEEAVFLTRFASKVTVVHRREELRASKIMAERAQKHPKISWELGQHIEEVLGNGKVSGLRLKDGKTGQAKDLTIDGLFLAIGHIPNSSLFTGVIKTDAEGYILANEKTETNIPGVFACGDVVDRTFRQAITAAGSGCAAAISAERYLESVGH
jgi:thioredoxin reductase (NADPH)